MNKDNINRELEVIGKYMISQIRREMTTKNINASSSLYKSLNHNVDNGELTITSLDYGGVILGDGSKPTNKKPSEEMVTRITRWMSSRGMSALARGRGGRFRKQTPNTKRMAAYNISRRILENGIKGSRIIQSAVNKLEKRIEKGIVEAYKADIMNQLDETLLKINK